MNAQSMGQQHLDKCSHEGCVCTIGPGQTYCSDFCARESENKTTGELPGEDHHHLGHCECGHDACEHAYARSAAQPSALQGSAAGAHTTTAAETRAAGKEALQNTGED